MLLTLATMYRVIHLTACLSYHLLLYVHLSDRAPVAGNLPSTTHGYYGDTTLATRGAHNEVAG